MIKFFIPIVILFFNSILFAKENISLQLHWKHQFEFAGFYMAKEKGFYKDLGLELVIKEFEDGIDISNEVSKGRSTFGVNYPTVIIDESKGLDLKLLAATLQRSPYVLVSLDKSGIKKLEGFKNKTIMLPVKNSYNHQILSVLKANGVSVEDLKIVKDTYGIKDLIDGTVDLKAVYKSNELYYLDKNGINYTIWDAADYGFDFYSNLIFTSNKYAKEKPEVLDKFIEASIKGWEYAFNNIKESVDVILKKHNPQNKTAEQLIYEAEVLKKLAYLNTNKFGKIEEKKLKSMYSVYSLMNLTKNRIDWDKFIYDYYKQESEIKFTDKEKAFIESSPIIRVHNESNWPPYNFAINGKPHGYSIDYMNLIAKKTGLRLEYITGPTWNGFLGMMQDKTLDVMLNIVKTPQREKYLLYTQPFVNNPNSILSKKNNPYKNLQSLEGKTIAYPEGFFYDEILKKDYPKIKRLPVKNIIEAMKAVSFGKADAALGELAVFNHLLSEHMMSDLFISGEAIIGKANYSLLHMATRKDLPILQSILSKGINSITIKEQKELQNKWLGVNKDIIALTQEEKKYLSKKTEVKMCVNPSLLPYEYLDKNGVYGGVGSDITKKLSTILDLPFTLVPTKSWVETLNTIKDGKCDIIPVMAATPERQSYLNFSEAYSTEAIVVATLKDKLFINSSEDLSGKKIGIVKGYAFIEILKEKNPQIEIVNVKSSIEGLKKVKSGELYGYLDVLPVIAYQIQQEGLIDIKISGRIEFDVGIRVGSRKDEPLLDSIIEKALVKIPDEEIKAIIGKWITINVEQSIDYKKLIYFSLFIFIIFAIVLYNNRKLRSLNIKLKNKTSELELVNQKLEYKTNQLQLIMNSVPVIIGYLDKKMHYKIINNQLYKQFGINPKNLIGKHHKELAGDAYKKEEPNYLKALSGETVVTEEHYIFNEKEMWHTRTLIPHIMNGQVKGIFGLYVNNTEIKKVLSQVEKLNKELDSQNKKLEELSITDRLTKLYNRHKLDEVLENEKNRSDRYGSKFGLILLDIDHFKSVNDTYGHDVGDSVLIEFAKILKEKIRITDIVGRWGGEEFLIICTESDLEQTIKVAEKCRKEIESFNFTTVKHKTSSFGVAIYKNNISIKDLIVQADVNLYEAKESGRNKVVY